MGQSESKELVLEIFDISIWVLKGAVYQKKKQRKT